MINDFNDIALMLYPHFVVHGGVEKHLLELSEELYRKASMTSILVSFNTDPFSYSILPVSSITSAKEQKDVEYIHPLTIIRFRIPKTLGFLKKMPADVRMFFLARYYGSLINQLLRNNGLLIRKGKLRIIYAAEPLAILALRTIMSSLLNSIGKIVAGIHTDWNFRNYITKSIARSLLKDVDICVVNNINTLTYQRIKQLCNQTYFIPNWVDTSRFRPRDNIKEYIREKLGLPKHSTIILSIFRFTQEKNPLNLIKALKIVIDKYPDKVISLIVGSGPLRKDIEIACQKLRLTNSVKIIDPIPHSHTLFPLIYNAADFFVLVPFHEGVSMVVLEALASGLPVVYSNVPGIPKNLSNSLLLANPHSPLDIAEKILNVMENPELRERLSTKGLETVEKYYEKHKVLQMYLKTLLE